MYMYLYKYVSPEHAYCAPGPLNLQLLNLWNVQKLCHANIPIFTLTLPLVTNLI